MKVINFPPLILLCGGKSSRMGSPKGLLEIEGRSWLEHHLYNFHSSGGTTVILVLGYHSEKYIEQVPCINKTLDEWENAFGLKMYTTVNSNPELGQFSSLIKGLEVFNETSFTYSFISPIDTLPPHEKLWTVLTNSIENDTMAVIPKYEGKGGHPVLISKTFTTHLQTLSLSDPKARLDVQIKELGDSELIHLEVDDPNIVHNINTIEDFKKIVLKG